MGKGIVAAVVGLGISKGIVVRVVAIGIVGGTTAKIALVPIKGLERSKDGFEREQLVGTATSASTTSTTLLVASCGRKFRSDNLPAVDVEVGVRSLVIDVGARVKIAAATAAAASSSIRSCQDCCIGSNPIRSTSSCTSSKHIITTTRIIALGVGIHHACGGDCFDVAVDFVVAVDVGDKLQVAESKCSGWSVSVVAVRNFLRFSTQLLLWLQLLFVFGVVIGVDSVDDAVIKGALVETG